MLPVQAAEAASGALPGLAAGRGGVRGSHNGRGHRHNHAPGGRQRAAVARQRALQLPIPAWCAQLRPSFAHSTCPSADMNERGPHMGNASHFVQILGGPVLNLSLLFVFVFGVDLGRPYQGWTHIRRCSPRLGEIRNTTGEHPPNKARVRQVAHAHVLHYGAGQCGLLSHEALFVDEA